MFHLVQSNRLFPVDLKLKIYIYMYIYVVKLKNHSLDKKKKFPLHNSEVPSS